MASERGRIHFGGAAAGRGLTGFPAKGFAVVAGPHEAAFPEKPLISPDQNFAVVRWIDAKSSAPRMTFVLWAAIIKYCDVHTGEILRGRQELADEANVPADHVSRVLGNLASIGVVERQRVRVEGISGPGAVRYWLRTDFAPADILAKAGLASAPGSPPPRWRRRSRRVSKGGGDAGAARVG